MRSLLFRQFLQVKNNPNFTNIRMSSSAHGSGTKHLIKGTTLILTGAVGGTVWYASKSEEHRKHVEDLIPGVEDLLDIFLGLSPSKVASWKEEPSGVIHYKPVDVKTLKPGDGATFPRSGQRVKVHYVLTLTNGKVVDSSRARGAPLYFRLGRSEVIAGWEEGVAKMSVGERAKLTVPPEMGYGGHGIGAIPANATLLFDIELLGVD